MDPVRPKDLLGAGPVPGVPAEPSPPPSPPATPAADSPLLRLPADVVLLVGDRLDTPDALSFSLACKATMALCLARCRRGMAPRDRARFLVTLERDARLGRGVFYCPACGVLHPFDPAWAPGRAPEPGRCGSFRDRFAPLGNPLRLSYGLARLVVNHHLYGPGRGVPLANLCVEHTERRPGASIRCSTDARIRAGELFLRCTYAFSVPDDAAAVAAFRKSAGPRDFRLCEHTSLLPNASVYRQYVPELQAPRGPAGGGPVPAFAACRDAPGSCGLCLMDYDVSVERAAGAWDVSIRAYHQLGACRSPDDWKWARFTEACRPQLFLPNRPNRRSSTHNPGVVKQRWAADPALHQQQQPLGGSDNDAMLGESPPADRTSIPMPPSARPCGPGAAAGRKSCFSMTSGLRSRAAFIP